MLDQAGMGAIYSHLTQYERDLIAILLAKGLNKAEIARRLGKNKSTITRELARNGPKIYRKKYMPNTAQERTEKRRKKTYAKRTKMNDDNLKKYVKSKLELGWSPEIIAGRLNRDGLDCSISPEAIHYIGSLARAARMI